MERLYCTINEEQARIAHDMMSMSDYKVGSKTEEYRGYVDKAYDLAEKVAEARPRETDRVEALAKRYSKRMAEYMNRESNIGCRCPSVMISGAGNFPVKKKEKQVQAWEKNHQFYTETQKILDKIKGILRGKDIIKSSDEDAIERLEEKLDALKENQERMRAVNKAIRLKNTKKGDEELKILGYSDEQIQELRTPDFMGRVGFPAYALQNNNANIHRVEERLKSLKAVKEKGTKETEFELFKVVENVEAMRLQIIFDGKPEADVRAVLKKHGFKWAPSQIDPFVQDFNKSECRFVQTVSPYQRRSLHLPGKSIMLEKSLTGACNNNWFFFMLQKRPYNRILRNNTNNLRHHFFHFRQLLKFSGESGPVIGIDFKYLFMSTFAHHRAINRKVSTFRMSSDSEHSICMFRDFL